MNYNREKQRLAFRGVNLNCAVDAIPKDQLGIATNVRPTQQGTLGTRPAISPFLNPSSNPVHSLKTFTANAITRHFSGSAGNLFMNGGQVDTGYSGNPLSFAAYQPSQAVQPFLYVADSARYRKVRAVDGAVFNVGIAPPSTIMGAELMPPQYFPVNDFDSATSWVAAGTAGSISAVARVPGSTTIAQILYDAGSTGWACVAFATSSTAWLTKGARIIVSGTESSVITQMVAANSRSTTTIAAIQYDSGTVGACCVVLTSNTANLERNSFMQLNSEYVRVVSVSVGEDNNMSFRCVTTGTHAAGETVTFYNCARMYFALTHANGDAVTGNALTSAVTAGTGTMSLTGLTLDLSQINGRPLTPQDWMHISLLVDVPANIATVRILLDVDNTTNDFAHNYFYADVTANVLQQASSGAQTGAVAGTTALSTIATLAQIQEAQAAIAALGSSGNYSEAAQLQGAIAETVSQLQLETGASQWSEIFIPLSNLTRVGDDQTVGLDNVKGIQIQIICTATVNVQADAWWVGGTYGPNAPESLNPEGPILYTFRYRSTITGAQTTWAPLTRGSLFPERQAVFLSANYSADVQADTIDFARVGGSINGTPQYLASIANVPGSGFGTYVDEFADAQLGAQIEQGDNQPWPIQQPPIMGTCSVVGTTVFNTSVAIPANLCVGTLILVNGVGTIINGQPYTHSFQIEDNVAFATGVPFQIGAPTTYGNPLPYLAGPFDETFFAWGDPLNPGRMYFANRTNPDTAKTSNFIDLTSSTEPGLGVAVWNGYVIAMTGEQFFVGTTTQNATTPYAFTTTSVGCGLLAPWAFSVGPGIFFWTRNGIAVTDLGPAKVMSTDDLYPYLPHEGIAGVAVNGYSPPPLNVQPRLAYLKNGWLYVDFLTVSGPYQTLAFDTTKPGWWFDVYTPGVALHYQDEEENSLLVLCGCADGSIQKFSASAADTGGPINCQARLGANNFGDIRSLKQAIDMTVNASGTLTVKVLANSWTVAVFSDGITGVTGTPQILPIAAAYDPTKLYLDFALNFTWTGNQQIIEYDLGYLQNPMLAGDFVSNPTTLQFEGYGHIREVILNTVAQAAMTANLVIQCELPGTITIPITIAKGATRQYIPFPPNKGMLYEVSLQGSGLDFGMFACDFHVKGWRENAYRIAAPFVE